MKWLTKTLIFSGCIGVIFYQRLQILKANSEITHLISLNNKSSKMLQSKFLSKEKLSNDIVKLKKDLYHKKRTILALRRSKSKVNDPLYERNLNRLIHSRMIYIQKYQKLELEQFMLQSIHGYKGLQKIGRGLGANVPFVVKSEQVN